MSNHNYVFGSAMSACLTCMYMYMYMSHLYNVILKSMLLSLHRSTLHALESRNRCRATVENSSTSSSSHTNYRYLTSEKNSRLKELQNERRKL